MTKSAADNPLWNHLYYSAPEKAWTRAHNRWIRERPGTPESLEALKRYRALCEGRVAVLSDVHEKFDVEGGE